MNDKNGIGLANCGNCKRFRLCGRWSDKSEYHECYNGDGLTPLAVANARIEELEAVVEDQKRELIERFNRARHYEDKYGELLRRQIDVGALVKPLVWKDVDYQYYISTASFNSGEIIFKIQKQEDIYILELWFADCDVVELSENGILDEFNSLDAAKQAAYTWLCDFVRAACGKGEK